MFAQLRTASFLASYSLVQQNREQNNEKQFNRDKGILYGIMYLNLSTQEEKTKLVGGTEKQTERERE